MRIIAPAPLKEFAVKHPQALPALDNALYKLKQGDWRNINEVKVIFANADEVVVKSGRKVVVLNASGNNWRVVVAFHYNIQKVFVLKVMSHAEYSRENWKETL